MLLDVGRESLKATTHDDLGDSPGGLHSRAGAAQLFAKVPCIQLSHDPRRFVLDRYIAEEHVVQVCSNVFGANEVNTDRRGPMREVFIVLDEGRRLNEGPADQKRLAAIADDPIRAPTAR